MAMEELAHGRSLAEGGQVVGNQEAATTEPNAGLDAPPKIEYATKEDLRGLTEAVQALRAKLDASEPGEAATQEDDIDRLYNQLIGESAPKQEGEPADPTEQRLARMEKLLAQQLAMTDSQRRATARAEINSEFRAKYDDWKENEGDIWKMAKQHPTLDGDQVYVLWKLSKYGPEALSGKEKKVATDAAKVSGEAKAAASEKPGAPAAGKTREPASLGELLRETWDNMPAKPRFS